MQIVPDYLNDYLDTERAIYLLLVIGCLGAGYYLYQLNHRRVQATQNARNFASKVPQYQKLKRRYQRNRPKIPDELKQNPLSFMERVIPQEFLTNLQPTKNGGEEGYQFQLRLEAKRITKILSLVSTLEEEPLLEITEFSLIRKSLNSPKFHSVMKLRTIQ